MSPTSLAIALICGFLLAISVLTHEPSEHDQARRNLKRMKRARRRANPLLRSFK